MFDARLTSVQTDTADPSDRADHDGSDIEQRHGTAPDAGGRTIGSKMTAVDDARSPSVPSQAAAGDATQLAHLGLSKYSSDEECDEVAQRLHKAEQSKLKVNSAFKDGDDDAALFHYSAALRCLGASAASQDDAKMESGCSDNDVHLPPGVALVAPIRQRGSALIVTLHTNMSAVLLRTGKAADAKRAASAALVLCPSAAKARRRRAAALTALGEHAAACADLAVVWKRMPASECELQ